jgi:hypothetical protein
MCRTFLETGEHPDGVAMPSGRIFVGSIRRFSTQMIIRMYLKAVWTIAILDPCLAKKSNFFFDSEWRPDGVVGRPNGCTRALRIF